MCEVLSRKVPLQLKKHTLWVASPPTVLIRWCSDLRMYLWKWVGLLVTTPPEVLQSMLIGQQLFVYGPRSEARLEFRLIGTLLVVSCL